MPHDPDSFVATVEFRGWDNDPTMTLAERIAAALHSGPFSLPTDKITVRQVGPGGSITAELPTVQAPPRIRLDEDTHDVLARLLKTARRNDLTVEVDTTDLALVVEHLAEAAGLDTDDL